MNFRINFLLIFCLSACHAQQPIPVKQPDKIETKKTETKEEKKLEPVLQTKQESYNFFLLMPVDLSEAFTLDSIVIDSSYVSESINKDIKSNIDFYEGALLAVDSLRKNGADVKLKVIDLPGDDEQQISEVRKINFENCNLVFSMLRSKPLSILNGILQSKNIPLISCAANTYSSIEKNKNAFCVQPSSLLQCRLMGEFAADNFKNDNIIIVSASTEKEKERVNTFILGAEKNIPSTQIKKVNLASEGVSAFNKTLSGTETNTVFIPSVDEDFVTTTFASIATAPGTFQFKVIGLPVWQHFESLDPQMMEKYNTIIFSPDNLNFNAPATIKFREKFRHLFQAEPGDAAYLAFDSFMLFGNLVSKNELDKKEINFNGLRSQYYFPHENIEMAQENKFVFILKLEDFRYVRIGK